MNTQKMSSLKTIGWMLSLSLLIACDGVEVELGDKTREAVEKAPVHEEQISDLGRRLTDQELRLLSMEQQSARRAFYERKARQLEDLNFDSPAAVEIVRTKSQESIVFSGEHVSISHLLPLKDQFYLPEVIFVSENEILFSSDRNGPIIWVAQDLIKVERDQIVKTNGRDLVLIAHRIQLDGRIDLSRLDADEGEDTSAGNLFLLGYALDAGRSAQVYPLNRKEECYQQFVDFLNETWEMVRWDFLYDYFVQHSTVVSRGLIRTEDRSRLEELVSREIRTSPSRWGQRDRLRQEVASLLLETRDPSKHEIIFKDWVLIDPDESPVWVLPNLAKVSFEPSQEEESSSQLFFRSVISEANQRRGFFAMRELYEGKRTWTYSLTPTDYRNRIRDFSLPLQRSIERLRIDHLSAAPRQPSFPERRLRRSATPPTTPINREPQIGPESYLDRSRIFDEEAWRAQGIRVDPQLPAWEFVCEPRRSQMSAEAAKLYRQSTEADFAKIAEFFGVDRELLPESFLFLELFHQGFDQASDS